MNIQPMKDKVLVAENKRETETASGIVLAGYSSSDTKQGTVLAVGPDVESVSVGDTVMMEWDKGSIVKVENDFRMIIAEEFIYGVVEK